jgi:arylsulfatase A-like enzyme
MIQRRKNSPPSFAEGVRIRNVRANSLALVLALGVSGITACSRNDAPPRVEHLPIVFILVDALRPDHMGVYGFARDTTPALSVFRRDAVLFENAYAAAPKTVPSVPQTLTSSYFPDALPAPSLMKTVDDAGYRHTAAIVNNPYASKWIGRQQPTFASVVGEELSATQITDRALSWLESASDPRLLAYLHYLDTHTPYRPPATYAELFLDPVYDGPITDEFSDVAGAWAGRYQTVDQLRILDLYDATIRYTDEQLGRLFDGIRELDI